MSKGLISFIVISIIAVAAAVLIYMKQSANAARKRSDEIMRQFKTIDKDLHKTNDTLGYFNKIDIDSLIESKK
jgi:hypothetical protein